MNFNPFLKPFLPNIFNECNRMGKMGCQIKTMDADVVIENIKRII